MWTVNRSKEFFDNGIMNKTGGFMNRAIMPETRVVVADMKAFTNIHRIFQLHQFDWIDNAPGEYSAHLTREFYSSYAATLMNFVADTETMKRGQKDMAITWSPLTSIIVRGKSIDISEALINRMLHGLEYSAPASVGFLEGKHHEYLAQDRFKAAGSANTEEFKSQLAEMRTQIAKLVEKLVQVPTPILSESLMQMLNQAASTQSIDDLWGEPPTSKSGKRKHKAGELDEENPTDPARESRRQEKRARRTSNREAREKEALE
uniref:Integrase core domain containing protein n=1 Tax=Solanum tuberosum TaxID=4113 RepID=M1DXK6_SOLTU